MDSLVSLKCGRKITIKQLCKRLRLSDFLRGDLELENANLTTALADSLHDNCSLDMRNKELETVLRMVKDNDIQKFMNTGEYGVGQLVREEIQNVLGD